MKSYVLTLHFQENYRKGKKARKGKKELWEGEESWKAGSSLAHLHQRSLA